MGQTDRRGTDTDVGQTHRHRMDTQPCVACTPRRPWGRHTDVGHTDVGRTHGHEADVWTRDRHTAVRHLHPATPVGQTYRCGTDTRTWDRHTDMGRTHGRVSPARCDTHGTDTRTWDRHPPRVTLLSLTPTRHPHACVTPHTRVPQAARPCDTRVTKAHCHPHDTHTRVTRVSPPPT